MRRLVALLCLLMSTHVARAIDPASSSPTPAVNPPTDPADLVAGQSQRGTLLRDRFGVQLALQPPWGGGQYNSFDFSSFVPTKNTATVDWIESDWYGNWSMANWNYTTIRGQYPSGAEYYDVEAIYFDNDDVNLYIAIVTSTPHLKDWGNGNIGVGIFESRATPGVWIRPGDLSINLGLNPSRLERNGTRWSYDYGVDITHDDRDQLPGLYTMRDNEVGGSVYRTRNDLGGFDDENPQSGDWYTSGINHNVAAYWEHTNFDPQSTVSESLGITYVGEARVRYYQYVFPNNQLENNAETYIVEVTIPRALLGADNPSAGDTVGIRWVMGCRNDGNTTQAVVKLYGVIDDVAYDFGDAPDPSYPTLVSSDGARHVIDGSTYLGKRIDGEPDGQPGASAKDDDFDGNDDEDGVTFTSALIPGQEAGVTVLCSAEGFLNAWIDFNGDGDWLDTDEQIFTDSPLLAGTNALQFSVPSSAVVGLTYARFRFSTTGGLGPTGAAADGEVEDYQLAIGSGQLDFGDAPGVYPTLLASGGARHFIDGVRYLGASVDAEDDGQPDQGALGDDTGGADDEDGVVFTGAVRSYAVNTVQVTASTAGILNAWIDFNRDGDWADPLEHVFIDRALVAGANTLTFIAPAVDPGVSFARFRFSSASGITYSGLAPDGEVEDHPVQLQASYDFGDAQDPTFPTRLANNGARHVVDGILYLGTRVDAEQDGQPNSTATGDDNDGNDDEDGVTFVDNLTPGFECAISVRASAAGVLNAWLDFNRDGDWADAGEHALVNRTLVAGVNDLTVAVPANAQLGNAFARFRYSSAGNLGYVGPAPDGEVEDYRVTIQRQDFGDAPSAYPVTLASNGARHTLDGMTFLGSAVDAEPNGQASAAANGDDVAGTDDEDGVTFTSVLTPGQVATLSVVASVNGLLDAWIDFNRDNDWADTGERIFQNQALTAGSNDLSFQVPSGASLGSTYARFRFRTSGTLSFNGSAANGEVEDYLVVIRGPSDLGDAPYPYPTLLGQNGAVHTVDGATYLGNGVDTEPNGQPSAQADGDDLTGLDDEDGVTFPSPLVPGLSASVQVVASVSGYLNAWIDFNRDGDWQDQGEHILVNATTVPGTNNLSFSVPSSAAVGTTYARFRFSTASGLSYEGSAPNGEVEDYLVSLQEPLDLGDAADPPYPTLVASNGARHVVDWVTYLGASVDPELDGHPHGGALGDDMAGQDDEDGVTFPSMLVPGFQAPVRVVASVSGYLSAWIDFNADGDWGDAGEQIFADQQLAQGQNNLVFQVPAGASLGPKTARFRFSTATGLGPAGPAPNGEVEDYVVSLDIPVELGSFSGTVVGTGVELTWCTYSEHENLGFRIYRALSSEGPYVLLTTDLIPGAGTTTQFHEYCYVDETVRPGQAYFYQLADVSSSGVETLHGPVAVTVPALPALPVLEPPSPHPVRDSAVFRFGVPEEGRVRLTLYDLAGREHGALVDGSLKPGWYSITLRGGDYPKGILVARLATPSGVVTRQIVIAE